MIQITKDLYTNRWADLVRDAADDVHTHAAIFDATHSPIAATATIRRIEELESILSALRTNITRTVKEENDDQQD